METGHKLLECQDGCDQVMAGQHTVVGLVVGAEVILTPIAGFSLGSPDGGGVACMDLCGGPLKVQCFAHKRKPHPLVNFPKLL